MSHPSRAIRAIEARQIKERRDILDGQLSEAWAAYNEARVKAEKLLEAYHAKQREAHAFVKKYPKAAEL